MAQGLEVHKSGFKGMLENSCKQGAAFEKASASVPRSRWSSAFHDLLVANLTQQHNQETMTRSWNLRCEKDRLPKMTSPPPDPPESKNNVKPLV